MIRFTRLISPAFRDGPIEVHPVYGIPCIPFPAYNLEVEDMKPVTTSALPALLSGLRLALSSPVVGHSGARLAVLATTRSLAAGRVSAASILQNGHLQHVRNHSCGRVGGETRNWGFRSGAALGWCSAICGLGYICGGSEPGGVATALTAAALLNGALLVHEAGHWAAARALGVAVREFSVGIGPRVAWWQGASTTYCLRALPLFGYVTFLTASHLSQAAAAPAVAAAGAAGAVHLPYPVTAATGGSAAAAIAGRRPLVLLHWLTPGRRAVVAAAGVVANVMLAGAFVTWQILSYGELGVMVRPGAKIRRAEGWQGPEDAVPADAHPQALAGSAAGVSPERRLRAGDVVIRVGARELTAAGDVEQLFVEALTSAAAAAKSPLDLITTHGGSRVGDDGGGEDAIQAATTAVEKAERAVESLRGIQLTVMRSYTGGSGSAESCLGGGCSVVLSVDAADVLRYETLSVSPNYVSGYGLPRDGWEAVAMLGREMASWTSLVLQSWSSAIVAAVGSSSSSSSSNNNSAGSSTASSSCSSGSSSQVVGPLGLVASAAAMALAANREARMAPAANSYIRHLATAGDGDAGSSAGSATSGGAGRRNPSPGGAEAGPCTNSVFSPIESAWQPPPLLSMGVQLNLQLALINLMPLPVLDGGQLVLLALEAARGGRRLPPALEKGALVGSGLLVGCWVLAVSLMDVVGLANQAVQRLTAALQPSPTNYHNERLTAGAQSLTGAGPVTRTSLASWRRSTGLSGDDIDRGTDFEAAAAAGSWAT